MTLNSRKEVKVFDSSTGVHIMKIELKEPYRSLYNFGYLRQGKDGRKRVDLVNSHEDRTTTSYARYLKSVELGYVIPSDFEVDHIDGNCTNDDLDNLQILTKEQHLAKTSKEMSTGRSTKQCVCTNCGIVFIRFSNLVNKERNTIFCSRSCNGKYYSKVNPTTKNKSEEIVKEILRLSKEGYSSYTIAKELGVARNTILKYRKLEKQR